MIKLYLSEIVCIRNHAQFSVDFLSFVKNQKRMHSRLVHLVYFFSKEEVEEYGVDWDGPIPGEVDMDVEAVLVPETNSPISQEDYDELFRTINPLRESNSYGIDIYVEVKEFVRARVVDNH